MAVPKSTVKSLSVSHSKSASILNNHPHPHLHHHIHSKYHYQPKTVKAEEHVSEKKKYDVEMETNETKNPTSWDLQDDLLLRHLKEVRKFGWKEISKYFINRTPNACQFRWRRLKSGNLKTNHTATMDIYSIDTTTILKNMGVDKKLPDLIDPLKNNDTDILLPQVELTIQPNTNATTSSYNTNVKAKKKQQNQHHSHQDVTSPLSRPYMEESTNMKFSLSSAYLPNKLGINKTDSNQNNELQPHGMRKTKSFVSVPTFVKPRSFSLNVARPSLNINNTIQQQHLDLFQSEEENIGFIPKIIVRSRRSSFNSNPNTNLMIPANITGIDISRRNSIVSSRRSSLNVSLNSADTSRRSSFIIPNEFIDTQLSSQSIIHLHPTTQCNNIQHGFTKWEQKEDKLLLDLINIKNLNLKEISILMPNRSEEEIKWRVQYLSKDKPMSTTQLNDNEAQLE
ncbi:transcriptional regulatory protein Tod6p [Monosporozyma servazzii]